MTRVLALLLALLASPAWADMYDDARNAKLPEARYNIGSGDACNPVSDFGADPTGVADATAAINSCAAVLRNGRPINVYLPAGNYKVTNAINITARRNIFGDGRNATIILVDQAFSPAATAVINLTSVGVDPGPEVRDLAIHFAQPSTQGSRAAFLPLGTCTSTEGGTGCKYPPAIKGLTLGARYKVTNVRIARAWDGIVNDGNIVWWLQNIEMSALNDGLRLTEAFDFSHIKGFHFWNFEIQGASALSTGVFYDGLTYAMRLGSLNGVAMDDIAIWRGKVRIDGTTFWGDITNIRFDGHGSNLEVYKNSFPGIRITNMYTTGTSLPLGDYGTGTGPCKVTFGTGNTSTQMVNVMFDGAGNDPLVCVQAGRVRIADSVFLNNTPGPQRSVLMTSTAGIQLRGNSFEPNSAGAWTAPLIDNQGTGVLRIVGNTFPVHTTPGNVGSIKIANDNLSNYIAQNNTAAWRANLDFQPSATGGYYDLGDQGFRFDQTPGSGAVLASFATPGDAIVTPVAWGGGYTLRGSFIQGALDVSLLTNTYTGTPGRYQIEIPGMPVPLGPGCTVHAMDGLNIASHPSCNSANINGSGGFTFDEMHQNLARTVVGPAEVPPNRSHGWRLSWIYNFR